MTIQSMAASAANRLMPAVTVSAEMLSMSFEAIYEQLIYPDYGIVLEDKYDLGYDNDGIKILGKYDSKENVAFIDRSVSEKDPRRSFTCYHEVGGHAVEGRVLCHRRHDDAVGQCDAADGERLEQGGRLGHDIGS